MPQVRVEEYESICLNTHIEASGPTIHQMRYEESKAFFLKRTMRHLDRLFLKCTMRN